MPPSCDASRLPPSRYLTPSAVSVSVSVRACCGSNRTGFTSFPSSHPVSRRDDAIAPLRPCILANIPVARNPRTHAVVRSPLHLPSPCITPKFSVVVLTSLAAGGVECRASSVHTLRHDLRGPEDADLSFSMCVHPSKKSTLSQLLLVTRVAEASQFTVLHAPSSFRPPSSDSLARTFRCASSTSRPSSVSSNGSRWLRCRFLAKILSFHGFLVPLQGADSLPGGSGWALTHPTVTRPTRCIPLSRHC